MPKQKKTWILVKGCEYTPGGCLSLGQILVKPFEPSLPLLPEKPLSIPETSIERTFQRTVETGSETSLSGSFKIWADVDLLPVSGELGAHRNVSKNLKWKFERLETEIMVPRLEHVRKAMQAEEVVSQINRKKFDFKKRLYMLTGVRIARGATLSETKSSEFGGKAKVGVDLVTLAAAPVSLGPEMEDSYSAKTNHSFEKASDFVYAYRVCEIHYGKEVYVEPFNKGDTFSDTLPAEVDEIAVQPEKEAVEMERIVVETLDSSDFSGANIPHKSFTLASSEGTEDEEQYILFE